MAKEELRNIGHGPTCWRVVLIQICQTINTMAEGALRFVVGGEIHSLISYPTWGLDLTE